jgi:UDPglucose--hexose-1-phosphate uridylyltransferase
MRSQLRKDYIQNKYVIIAPQRNKRPQILKQDKAFAKEVCPFCPKNVNQTKELYSIGGSDWHVKVIPNKFPAVSLDNPQAYGEQEVIIETPLHTQELEDLSVSHLVEVFKAYAARTAEISRDKNIDYILIFKNSGGKAGASLIHSHSQIFATDFLPPHLFDKFERTQAYKIRHGRCVYCDVIQKEQNGPRKVFEDAYTIAFCPYAPMHNYEVWIMPKRHLDNVTNLSLKEQHSFASILKKILLRIRALDLPYNYYFHQVVHDEDQHLYLKVVPRGSVWAGVEIGSGVIINPISPEAAAKFFRK